MLPLDGYKPFCDLSSAGKKILQHCTVSHHKASQTPLLTKGQPISGAYFVLEGQLRVFSLSPDGQEATLYFINPGETCIFALNSVFNDLLYPAWVQAVAATTLTLIPGPQFRQLFAQESVIQDLTVRAQATLVFRLMAELEAVHAYRLNQRLANLLLAHANSQGELRMTQQQIAGHLGTSREVVARIVREMVSQGWITTQRGGIRICQTDSLNALLKPSPVAG